MGASTQYMVRVCSWVSVILELNTVYCGYLSPPPLQMVSSGISSIVPVKTRTGAPLERRKRTAAAKRNMRLGGFGEVIRVEPEPAP